jgi:hypothetical protein
MKVFRIPLLICAICCFAWQAYATSSRVASMGGGDDYFEDVNNVLRWYGSLASYGGTALFEFGDAGDYGSSRYRRAAAVIAELGNNGSLGTGGLFLFGEDPQDVLRLAWGKEFGNLQLGCQWRLSFDSWEIRNYALYDFFDYEYIEQSFGVGGRYELGERTYLDAAVDIDQTWNVIESMDTGDRFESGYDADTYSARARLFHGVSERTVIVPMLEFVRHLNMYYDRNRDDYYDQDHRKYRVGLGWNYMPDVDTMLVGSISYRYFDIARRYPRLGVGPSFYHMTENHYTLRFGLERRTASWLTLRAGVWQKLWNYDLEEKQTAEAVGVMDEGGWEDLELTLGLAVHFGPFDADLVFNDNAPFNVGSIFTQAGADAPTTWNKITLQYVF